MLSLNAVIRAAAATSALVAPAGGGIVGAHGGTFPKHNASNRSTSQPIGIPGRWKLVLDSVFSGPRLPRDWHTGWFGNGVTAPVNRTELACYSPANVSFPGDGTLHLKVTAQASICGGQKRPYTGAMVTTNPADSRTGFEYRYGALQARVYVPADRARIADWPAVWTDGQSWPADGEDDLMEGLDGTACFHFHDQLGHAGGCDRQITPGWHTFASEWRQGSVVYFYDGARVGSVTIGVTAAPMYLLLDDTVSGGGAQVTAPGSLRVRYVRVWQRR